MATLGWSRTSCVPRRSINERRIWRHGKGIGHRLIASLVLISCQSDREGQPKERPVKYHTVYRTQQVDGLSIFYREAGPKDAPTLLLLHGLPSSSRMFEPLFSRLAEHYHLVAPDYPGFGHSD